MMSLKLGTLPINARGIHFYIATVRKLNHDPNSFDYIILPFNSLSHYQIKSKIFLNSIEKVYGYAGRRAMQLIFFNQPNMIKKGYYIDTIASKIPNL